MGRFLIILIILAAAGWLGWRFFFAEPERASLALPEAAGEVEFEEPAPEPVEGVAYEADEAEVAGEPYEPDETELDVVTEAEEADNAEPLEINPDDTDLDVEETEDGDDDNPQR